MTKGAKAFVDTNVLLRAMTTTAALHQQADTLVKETARQGYKLWISRQVIREYLVQVSRPQNFAQPLSIDEIEQKVQIIESIFKIADETQEVTAQLLKLLRDFPTGGKQIHDANIVATMLTYGIDTLLTQNIEDMKRYASKITLIPLM